MKAEFMCIGEVMSKDEIREIVNGRIKSISNKNDWLVHIKHTDYTTFIRIKFEDLREIWNLAQKEKKRKERVKYDNL